MVSRQLSNVVRHLRRIVSPAESCALTDAQLLDHFASRRDEGAFEVLLSRHGPMVRGLCRSLLRNVHDAEDAFQATFLILVQKAGSLRERNLLGHWLYGVAYRVAVRVRAANLRRHAMERLNVTPAGTDPPAHELRWLLHDELNRLPEKYRKPVVLCYLQDNTNEEAARRLGWPVGTVKGRLNRARMLLRRRLSQQGVTLSSGALAAALSPNAAPALPPPLIVSTAKAALALATGGAAAPGGASTSVVVLVNGALRAMALTRLKVAAAVLLMMAVLLPGAGLLAYRAVIAQSVVPTPPAARAIEPTSPRATAAPGETAAVDLNVRFKPGEAFYQTVTTDVTQAMKVKPQGDSQNSITQNQSQTFWVRWTPQGKQGGTYVLKQKIMGLMMDWEVGGDKLGYDSRKKNEPANLFDFIGSAVRDADFTVYLSSEPNSDNYLAVVKVDGQNALMKKLLTANAEVGPVINMVKKNLGDDAFKQLAEPHPPGALCGRPVRKGASWTGRGKHDLGQIGVYVTDYHYTYEGREGSLDRISVKTTLKYSPPDPRPRGDLPFDIIKADFKRADGSGVVLFDRTRSRIASATLDARLEGALTISIGGMNSTVDVAQTQKTTVKSTDANPIK
jgi:RNA polymerase sigma factor (sigma-70 family)